MANVKFTNFATTTLVGTYGVGDTALTVANGALFPAVSGGTTWFYAVITDSLTTPSKREIVKVTNRAGNVLTVTRAQDNTSAQTWATGNYIELRLVNKALEDMMSETVTDSRTSTTDYTTIADSDANGSGSHIRKIGSTTYETLSSTVDVFEVPVSQPREISVAEHGAVGNYNPWTGVGTDDTAAIQAALDAAYTAGGGIVTLENKNYKLGSALTIPTGVVLKGVAYPTGGYVGGNGAAWVVQDLTGFKSNATGGTWTLTTTTTVDQLPHYVTITNDSPTDHSAKTVTLLGTDYDGNAVTEVLSLPAALSTVVSTKKYKTLTSPLTPSSSIGADTMDIGWSGGGVNPELGAGAWSSGGRLFRNMKSSLWVCFDAGKGDGTATYNVQQAHGTGSGLPNFTTRTGAILVKGEIRNLNLFQYSFNNNNQASYTDNGNWNSAWDSGYMSGLAISLESDDSSVQNCFIGGFQQAILGYDVARVRIDNVHLDCINGIELSSVYDRAYINRVHGYLFSSYSNGGAGGASLVRRGDFIYAHDTVDWLEVTNCFTYGHKWGYYLANINEASLYNCAADNTTAETVGYYGVYIAANTQDVHISDMRVAARQYGLYMDNGNTNVVSVTNSTFLVVDYGYYVNTGNLRTFGGKITMSGANKIGYYNASTGTVSVYGPLVSGETAVFSGANFSYIDQNSKLGLAGTGPQIRMDDTTDDVAIQIYSDAATDMVVDAFQASNSANKRTLFLNKYGGSVATGAGGLVLPATTGIGIKVDTTTPTFGWRDIIGNVQPKATGAGSPTRAAYAGANVADYSFALNDLCDFVFHIPHDYVPGSDLYCHVHWSHTDAVSITGNVVFTVYFTYAKGHNQANFPAEKTTTITYATTNIATTPQYRHRIDEVAITGATATGALFDNEDIEVDGIILATLKVTTLPTFGGTGKLFVHTCDVHYQSNNMATKNKAPTFYG